MQFHVQRMGAAGDGRPLADKPLSLFRPCKAGCRASHGPDAPYMSVPRLQCNSSVAAFKAAPSSSAAGRQAVQVVAQKRVQKKQQVRAAVH